MSFLMCIDNIFRHRRNEYLPAIIVASIMKLLAFILVVVALGFRYGPQKDNLSTSSTCLFSISLFIEFIAGVFNFIVVCLTKNCYHCKMYYSLCMVNFFIGIILMSQFISQSIGSEKITFYHSHQKGLAGLYCIFSASCLFKTCRDVFQPTALEMLGWFEVVFKDIIKLLVVSINRLLMINTRSTPHYSIHFSIISGCC